MKPPIILWLLVVVGVGVVVVVASQQVSQLASSLETSHRINKTKSSDKEASKSLFYDSQGNWRFKYIDEQEESFNLLIREESIDQRLANIVHTHSGLRILDLSDHKFASGDPKQDELNQQLAGNSPAVDDELCGQHLAQMLALMKELNQRLEAARLNSNIGQVSLNLSEQHYRLARVLDSFGRYDSGHLMGKTHSPGSYDQCIRSQLQLQLQLQSSSSASMVKYRFCWAKFRLDKHLHPTLKQRKRSKFDMSALIFAGVCLPESCHSKSFTKHPHLFKAIASSQFKLPSGIYVDDSLELDSIYCPVDSDSYGVPLSGKLWFCFVGLWSLVAIYSTYFVTIDKNDKQLTSRLLHCMNLKESWADFVETKEEQDESNKSRDKINFDALNPFKAIGTLMVVGGHCFIVQIARPTNQFRTLKSLEKDPFASLLMMCTFVVDSFSTITGILLAYVTIGKLRKSAHLMENWSTIISVRYFLTKWAQLTASRYLRLLPMFYLVFWFQKGVLIYLNGRLPYWDSGFNKDTMMGACKQETWLSPLISHSAFAPIGRQCLPQTWSVSVDLILAIVVAPVIILFVRQPKLATAISLGLCLISVHWGHRSYYQLDAETIEALESIKAVGFTKTFNEGSHLYTHPLNRFCAIMVGLLVGYHLFQYKEANGNDDDRPQSHHWPRWLRGPATKASIVTVLSVLVVSPFLLPNLKQLADPYHKLFMAHMLSSFRFIWALASGVLFLRMVTDWKSSPLFSWSLERFWKMAVKLNYCTLLVHVSILFAHEGVQETFVNHSKYHMLTTFNTVYLFCLPISIVLYVLFENPLDKMVKRVLFTRRPTGGIKTD